MIKAAYEAIPASVGGQPFLARSFGKEAFKAPYHFHPEYELTWIVEGAGKRYVGSHMADYSRGDLVLLGANLPHCWKIDLPPKGWPETGRNDAAQAIVIHFAHDFLGNAFFSKAGLHAIEQLLERSGCGIQFTGDPVTPHGANPMRAVHRTGTHTVEWCAPHAWRRRVASHGGTNRPAASGRLLKEKDLAPVLQKMRELVRESNHFKKLILLLEILQTLTMQEYTLLDPAGTTAGVQAPEIRERIHPVFAYLVENFRQKVSLNQAAAIAGMTPNAFCKYFKRITRKTFVEMLIEYRLNYAVRQLVQTDKPVSLICFESGFGDLSHFHRIFRSKMNLSPLNYRKKFRQEVRG